MKYTKQSNELLRIAQENDRNEVRLLDWKIENACNSALEDRERKRNGRLSTEFIEMRSKIREVTFLRSMIH